MKWRGEIRQIRYERGMGAVKRGVVCSLKRPLSVAKKETVYIKPVFRCEGKRGEEGRDCNIQMGSGEGKCAEYYNKKTFRDLQLKFNIH